MAQRDEQPADARGADRDDADGTGPGGDDEFGGRPPVEPDAPRDKVVWQLTRQALSCAAMGSPLSAFLLDRAAVDVLEDGPCADLLLADVRPGRGDAAALRFLAALHRLVLDRRAPQLALHYPSVGGSPDLREVGDVMVATVADHLDRRGTTDAGPDLHELVALPCQTNAVGRSAGLVLGLLDAAAVTGLPLRLREVGASAGLNLRMDHFAFELPTDDGPPVRIGPADAEVVLRDRFTAPLPDPPGPMPEVVDRRGCDLRPIDPTTPSGRARVSSSVWCDQTERFELLGAALRTAQDVPAPLDGASAEVWLRDQLRVQAPGTCTVVYHSIVREYLPATVRTGVEAALVAAGARARPDAPIAHVAFEPDSALRSVAVTVRIWPHAPEPRVLATCGAHGTDVTPV